MRRFSIATYLASCLAVISSGGALAAETPKAPPSLPPISVSGGELGPEGTWQTQCDIDRMTDARACRMMTYRMIDEGAGKDPTYIAVSIIPTGNDYHMFLTTNQGMIQSCAIRVDRQPRIETYVATINMCMFPNFLSGRILDQFRNGSSVLVRVNVLRGARRDIDFTLSGFAKNFEDMQKALQ